MEQVLTSTSSNDMFWGPGFIGLMLSICMYGSGLGQSLFYSYHFPDDHILIKTAVAITMALDTIQAYGCVQLYWRLLITCRRDLSLECSTQLPMGLVLAVLMGSFITFVVQCFYAQRVWIVSGRHKIITGLAVIAAIAAFIVGLVCAIFTLQQQTIQYFFTTPLVPSVSALSTVCDIITTSSIVYFLRAGRSGQPERNLKGEEFIQQIRRVTINCGLLTCILSLATVFLYAVQGAQYLVDITGPVLSQSYTNSMLAVLNARKSIRDRERDCRDGTIEVPSIPMI